MSNITVIVGSSFNGTFAASGQTAIAGWVSGSNTRGTSDIILSSFSTIFLCTWTAMCLNIPHPDDTSIHILKTRCKWMFWAIVAPEIVLAIAIGQYASARRSVERFHKLGYSQWTLRHAFFVDMGGILLTPAKSASFVVNSRQLAYLVQNEYVDVPNISTAEIKDKSKTDTLGKLVTLFQACWLAFNLIGRTIRGLEITTLELNTGAIVFCTLGTFICWLHKPSDVKNGIVLVTQATTEDILRAAGDIAARPYKHTPLDFVAKESFTIGYDVFGFFNFRCDRLERPLKCFPNDRFPDISTLEKFLLFCWTTVYAGLHLLGWRFYFPSHSEALLWRISSLVITGGTVMWWTFETVAARYRFGRWDKYLIMLRLKKPVSPILEHTYCIEDQSSSNSAREISPTRKGQKQVVVVNQHALDPRDAFEAEQRKQKSIPMWEVLVLLPVILIYAAARSYQIVEAFVSLRELPVGVYQSFEIADLFPHL